MVTLARVVACGAQVVLALAVGGCATMSVHSYMERGTDFHPYRTFRIAPADTASTGDPRLDDNPFFHERMRAGVDKLLAARGYQRAGGSKADMLIHYHASVGQRLELNDSVRSECLARVGTGTEAAPNCMPYVYDAGTLMIDVVDGRTSKLLWRGWVEGSMDGVMANQEWMEQRIDESIQRILEKLPRRL